MAKKQKIALILFLVCLLAIGIKANATERAVDEEPYEEEMFKMWVTCYYANPDAVMANGENPYYGVVATSKNERIYNRTVLIYARNEDDSLGKLLYLGESRDTGGEKINTPTPEEEVIIDVFITDKSQMIPTQKCWVQVITAAG